MTEFPLLCIRGEQCHRDGPRTTGQTAWFCAACIQKMRENLELIATAWLDVERALVSMGAALREQAGRQKRGGKTHGLVLNETVVEARTKSAAYLRWAARDLMGTYDEAGRVLLLPENHTVPAVAQWIAESHLEDFTAHESDHIALEAWGDLAEIRSLIMRGAYPLGMGKLVLGIPCEWHGTSETGERTPCTGTLYTITSRKADGYSDLVCSEDRAHRVSPAEWLAGSWRRRHQRDMDQGGVDRLMRGLGLRHTSSTA